MNLWKRKRKQKKKTWFWLKRSGSRSYISYINIELLVTFYTKWVILAMKMNARRTYTFFKKYTQSEILTDIYTLVLSTFSYFHTCILPYLHSLTSKFCHAYIFSPLYTQQDEELPTNHFERHVFQLEIFVETNGMRNWSSSFWQNA